MKEQISDKQEQLDKSECDLQELKKNYSQLELQLTANKISFDLLLRQQVQSTQLLQKELQVCLTDCKPSITHIDDELG